MKPWQAEAYESRTLWKMLGWGTAVAGLLLWACCALAIDPIPSREFTLSWDVGPGTNEQGLVVWLCGPGQPVRTQYWTVEASGDLASWWPVAETNRPPVRVRSFGPKGFFRVKGFVQ